MLTGGWKNLISRIFGAPKGPPPRGTTSNSGRRPGSRLSIDRLEDRRVLDGVPAGFTGAITVTEGQVLLTAGPADGVADSYEVSVQHRDAGDTIEIQAGGETVFQAGVADFKSLTFEGSGDLESLTIQLDAGATLAGSIQFHGGASSGDFVLLVGGSTTSGQGESLQTTTDSEVVSTLTVTATGTGSHVQIQDWRQGQSTGLEVTATRIDVTGTVDLGSAGATLAGDQINVSGVLKSAGGTIGIEGTDTSTVTITGRLESRSLASHEHGGEINVFGHVVQLANTSVLDVSGTSGGGTIRVGGDFRGADGDFTVAARTGVAPGAQLIADSLEEGNGGRIVIWSTEVTAYHGNATASSPLGHGGFLEVSSTGKLLFRGDVELYGSTGVGTLLLDPRTVTIESATFSPDDPSLDDGVITFTDGGVADYTISERKVESMSVNMLIQATDWISIDIIDGEVLLQPNVTLTLQTENANAGNATGGIFCLDEHTILSARGNGSIILQAGVTANDQGVVTGRNGSAQIITGQILTQSGSIVLEATGLVQIQNQLTTTGGSVSIDGDAADNGTGQIEFGGPISTAGGLVSLVAGNFVGTPQIDAGSGEISISSSGGKTLGLGSAVGDLNLSQATLTSWTGGALTVGGMRNGSITVADLDLTSYAGGVTLLALKPGSLIAFTGAGSTFTALSATAAAGIDVLCPLTTTTGTLFLDGGTDLNLAAGVTLTSSAADIVLKAATGTITAQGPLTLSARAGVSLLSSMTLLGALDANADSDGDGVGVFTIATGAVVSGDGQQMTVTAGDMDLAGQVSLPGGTVLLLATNSRSIALGTAAGDWVLTGAELQGITAGVLTIGDSTNPVTVREVSELQSQGIALLVLHGMDVTFAAAGGASVFQALAADAALGEVLRVDSNLSTVAGSLQLTGGGSAGTAGLVLGSGSTVTAATSLSLVTSAGTMLAEGPVTLRAGTGISILSDLDLSGTLLADADSDRVGGGSFLLASGTTLTGNAHLVTITSADIDLAGLVANTAGTVTLLATAGRTMGVGTATGDWTLAGTELSRITAARLNLGDGTNPVTVSGVTEEQSTNIGLVSLSGLDVTFDGDPAGNVFQALTATAAIDHLLTVETNLTTVAGDLVLNGGGAAGVAGLTIADGVTLKAAGLLQLQTQAGFLETQGAANLLANTGVTLLSDLTLSGSVVVNADQDGVGAGTFTLGSGTTLTGNTHLITITSADIDLAGLIANSGGTVTLLATMGRSIGVGTATGDWTLNGDELSGITAATLNLGDGTNPVTVSGVTEEQSTNIDLVSLSGLDVTFDGDPAGNVFQALTATAALDHLLTVVTNLTTANGDLVLNGGGSAGVAGLTIADGVTLKAAGLLQLQTQAGFLETQGAANLLANTGVTLLSDLTLSGSVVVNADQDGVGAGTFTLGSGTTLTGNTHLITITSADIDLAGLIANTGGTVTLLATSGRTMGVGTATGDWTLDGTELSHITAATLNLGEGTNPLTVSGVTEEQSTNIGLVSLSGLDVTFDGDPAGNVFQALTATAALDHLLTVETNLTTVAGDLVLNGGGAAGVAGLTIADGVTLNAAGLLQLQTQAGFLETQGAANLLANSAVTLLSDLKLSGPLVVNADQDGVGAGTFTLGSGTILTGNTHLIAITSADIDLEGLIANAGGTVTLLATTGRSIGVGTATGDWTLDGDELSRITAATLNLGDGTNPVTVSGVTEEQSTNIDLVSLSGLDVTFDGDPAGNVFQALTATAALDYLLTVETNLTTVAGDLILNGGGSAGVAGLTIADGVTLNAAGLLQLQTQAGFIETQGAANLLANSGVTLLSDLKLSGPLVVNADHDGVGAGTFTLGSGTTLTGNTHLITITSADIDLEGLIANAGGTVTLLATLGRSIGVGTATGDWTLDGTELSQITAATLNLGDGTNSIRVSEVAGSQSAGIALVTITGLDTTFAGAGTSSTFQSLRSSSALGSTLRVDSDLTTLAGDLSLIGGGSTGSPGLVFGNSAILTSANLLQLQSLAGGILAEGELELRAAAGIEVLSDLSLLGPFNANADVDGNGTGLFTLSTGTLLTGNGQIIVISAADLDLMGSLNDAGGAVFLNASHGLTMGVGSATGDWTLDGTELSRITAGTLTIGNSLNAITVSEVIEQQSAAIDFVEVHGLDVTFAGLGTTSVFQGLSAVAEPGRLLKIDSNLTTLTSNLLLTGGGSAGTTGLTIAANVTLTSAQALQLQSAAGGMRAFGPLTLTASSGISIFSNLQLDGALLANADSDATGAGAFLLTAGSQLTASVLPITIASADINLAGTISDPGGTVTLVATGGHTMGVGAATGDWTLDSGEITRLVTANLILGGQTNGTVTVDALDSVLTAGFDQVEILALAQGSGIVLAGGESSFRQLTASAAEDIVIETTISSTVGPMTLHADTDLDGSGAVLGTTGLVQTDQLFVDAGSGIDLNTTISELSLTNRAIGTVTIHESDALVLRQVEQLGTGAVLVTACEQISVQRVFATGLVTLDAGTSITNGPDPAALPRLEAETAALIARTGIGSGDPLITSVGRLGAINSQSGQIEIQNVGLSPVTFGSAGSLAGLENQVAAVRIHTAGQMIVERIASPELIALTSLGGIEGTAGLGIDASAPQLALRTTGGTGELTPLETQISTLAAVNLVSGGLHLVNSGGALAIASADGLTGIENSGSGDIEIVNATRLDVNAVINSIAGGSITLTSLGNGSPGSDLTVNQPIRALGGFGDVILNAGTDLILVHSGGPNDPDIVTAGLDDTHQGKILGNAENIVQYGQGVLLKSGTGQVSVLTPLLIDVNAPVIQQSISLLTGTFGDSAEFNYTITVNWSDGYVTSAYVPGPGSYYYEFPGPATTKVTITATPGGPGAFEFRHFYLGNPNADDPSVPIPITVTVEDDLNIDLNGRAQVPVTTQINATDTLTTANDQATVRTLAEVAGTGFQGLVFYTRLELPPITLVPQSVGVSVMEAVVVPAVEVQQAQKINTVQRESLVTARQVYLEIVAEGADLANPETEPGTEIAAKGEAAGRLPRPENLVELSEDVLNDLPALFQRLPDGHYRIYLQEVGETRLRLLLDVELRGGRPSDGADLNLDKPPAETLPGDSADESAESSSRVPSQDMDDLRQLQTGLRVIAPATPAPEVTRAVADPRNRGELVAAAALLTATTAPPSANWETRVQEMLAVAKPGEVLAGARLARRLKRRFH